MVTKTKAGVGSGDQKPIVPTSGNPHPKSADLEVTTEADIDVVVAGDVSEEDGACLLVVDVTGAVRGWLSHCQVSSSLTFHLHLNKGSTCPQTAARGRPRLLVEESQLVTRHLKHRDLPRHFHIIDRETLVACKVFVRTWRHV